MPISNTSCKSDSDCALYGQALLDDNAIPRNNYQVQVFTYTDKYPSAPPMGLPRGDVILGVHNVKIISFEAGAPNINGLCISVQTTMDVKTGDTYQVAKFAQIQPGWNRAIASRAGKLALALRRNVTTPVSVDSYMVGPNADQYSYTGASLVVKNQAFQSVFAYGSGIQTIAATNLTMNPSTTNWVWLNNDGSFTITYQGEAGNPTPDQPPSSTCMLHSIFQTNATGVIGDIFKAPRGVLNNGGSGGPGGGVAALNGLSGTIALTSTGGSIVINPSGSSIDLEAALAGLTDVAITSLANGQVLAWNSTAGKWENITISGGAVSSGAAFPGSPTTGQLFFRTYSKALFWYSGSAWSSADAVAQLNDVTLTSLATGQILQWNGSAWVNVAPPAGGVTSVGAGTGIAASPNPIVATGTIALAAASDKTLKSNISGTSAVPVDNTLSAILDDIISGTAGTLVYRSSVGWTNLPIGTSAYVLTVVGGVPAWAAAGGGATIGYGTSFPGTPTDGELFFRTDTRAMFMYLASSPGPGWFSDQSLAQLEDVSLTSLTNLDYLQYNGTDWVNKPLTVPSVGSLPTAGSTYSGRMVRVLGGGTAPDKFYICRQRSDASYIWSRFQGRSVILSFASGEFTPSTVGKDVIVREVPYDPEEPGSPTVIAWTVVDIVFRIETPAASGTTSLKVQRSTGTGVFSNVGYLNTTSLDILATTYEPASGQKPCPLAVTSINSGDKLSPEYTAVAGGSAGYSCYVVLRES